MDQQQITSSPTQQSIYTNMFSSTKYFVHQEADGDDGFDIAKAAAAAAVGGASSSTRSPTTVFASDELSSVFRVSDDAAIFEQRSSTNSRIMLGAHEEQIDSAAAGGIRGIRRDARCLTPSFATDGELSTFSEDTASSEGSDNEENYRFLPVLRRRQAPSAIFRPVCGKRRTCDFEEDNEDLNSTPTKRSRSVPLLCHANPVGSDDGYDAHEITASYSFASPSNNKRNSSLQEAHEDAREESELASRELSSSSARSPYTSLFAESRPAFQASIQPSHLAHPLSFEVALPAVSSQSITKQDEGAKE